MHIPLAPLVRRPELILSISRHIARDYNGYYDQFTPPSTIVPISVPDSTRIPLAFHLLLRGIRDQNSVLTMTLALDVPFGFHYFRTLLQNK